MVSLSLSGPESGSKVAVIAPDWSAAAPGVRSARAGTARVRYRNAPGAVSLLAVEGARL
jgi:hypothetical protein